MKRLNEYLNEDFDPAICNHDGGISIDDPSVIEAINTNLEVSTAGTFRTPHNGLEEVRKVLEYYKIFLPKSVFLDKTDGNDVFQISQFGDKMGMNNQGEVVTASPSSLFVYFEWSLGEDGMYDVFAAVVDDDELDEIMADFESELEESVMPDLNKKMGAKKVTLPNMMKKDEKKLEEDYDHTAKSDAEDAKSISKSFRKKDKPEAKAWRQATKKLYNKAVTGLPQKKVKGLGGLDEASITVASKKAEKGTRWKVKSKNHDSEGSDIELRQGKRVKAVGGYYRDSQDFGLSKTKKGKIDMKDRGAYYDSAKDILKTVKEENITNESAIGAAIGMVAGGALSAATSLALHGKYGKKNKSVADRLSDTHAEKKYQKSRITQSDSSLKRATRPKTIERIHKDKADAQSKLKKTSYWKSLLPEENLQELSKGTLGSYITKASHDVATKSAAVGRYAERANRVKDEIKKGDYKNYPQGKKDDEFADKMFKKSWKRRQGIAKATDKLTREETINELHGKGSLEKIRDFHKKKVTELGKRANKVADTAIDRRRKSKSTVVVHHKDGSKTRIPGHGEAELTSVERNRDSLYAKRDLESKTVKRATGLIKKRESMKEETLHEISAKLASNYLKGNHKSVTDKKGIKLWKAYKRADGRELAVDKLSGKAKVNTVNEVSRTLAAKAAEAAYEAGNRGYENTTKLRGVLQKTRDPEDRKKASDSLQHMRKKWKQSMKFSDYAAKKINEGSAEKLGRYVAKASKQKQDIQSKGYANKLEKGDLPKFEKRKKGVQSAIKKLTGQAKVNAKE